jgi:cytochrome c oxidase cbb3-type subunit I
MFEYMKRPQSASLAFLVAGSAWFAIGTLYGLIAAIHLVAPEFFNNISWLVFGRTRPVHINTVLYGFVTETLIGAGLYYVPALLRTRLWSESLGWASFIFWNAAVISGPFTFSFGITQGREYTEYIWIFDVSITIALLLVIYNVIMTIANRTEKTLYVSVWYFTASFLWITGSYPIGNVMWHPLSGALPGLMDSILLWFYGHNLPGVLLTPLAVGAIYYMVPRLAKVPLYSHTLSLVGFWTLVAFYTHIGGHHILQAPVPNWLKVMSVVDSVAMVIPVITVLINVWVTARNRGAEIWGHPAGLFMITGTIWYLITCIQGPVQSLPVLQRITHFNNWTIGHAHIAVLGFSGFVALGALWYVLPYVAKKKIFSRKLVNLQYALVTFGITGFFIVLTIAGLIQGHAWYNGETVYRVLPEITVYMALRAAIGISIISAAGVGLYNLIMTLREGEPFDPVLDEGKEFS